MLKQLTHTQVWVHDQDEALAFYTEKLGMELREDVTVPELGNFRWLSVGVPGQPDVSITLMAVPGPPVFDDDTRAQIQALLAKGAAGALLRHRRREGELRGAEGPRRRVHAAADGAALRRRCGVPRPVGEPLPHGSEPGLSRASAERPPRRALRHTGRLAILISSSRRVRFPAASQARTTSR